MREKGRKNPKHKKKQAQKSQKEKSKWGRRDGVKSGAKREDTERVKNQKRSLQPIRKQSTVAGNDDGTHEGENRNVISWPLFTEENVWKQFRGKHCGDS